MPVVIGFAASSLLWGWMYNTEVGAVPALLDWAGITHEPIDVLAGGTSALLSVIVMVTWKTAGFTMILLLVGLQSIPQDVLDAAAVDGSRRWQTLRYVTLPLMRRTIALALILSVTGSFLAFDQFYIMTHGGPDNSTITIVYQIVRSAFVLFRLGYAGALAIVLLALLIVLNGMQFCAASGALAGMSADVTLPKPLVRTRAQALPRRPGRIIASASATILALLFVAPIVWSALSSLKTPEEAAAVPPTSCLRGSRSGTTTCSSTTTRVLCTTSSTPCCSPA